MASKIKVDQIETVDGTGNITVNQPLAGSGAGLTSLPAANLTGSLPAISGASLTSIPAANITGVIPAANLGTGTASASTFLNGSGAYSAAGGGATTLIGTATATNTQYLDFTGITGYEVYLLVFNALVPTTDAKLVELKVGTGSTTWETSGYKLLNNKRLSTDGADDHLFNNDDVSGYGYIPLSGSIGNATGENFSGFIYCFNLGATTFKHFAGMTPAAQSGGALQSGLPYGQFTSASVVTGLRINFASGTVASGSIRLYGLNNS